MRILPSLVASLSLVSLTASANTPEQKVTGKVTAYQNAHAFMGAVVAVVDHGYYYWFQYGQRDASNYMYVTTPVAIASNSKTFAATTLALADKYLGIAKGTELHNLVYIPSGKPPYHATLQDLVSYYAGLPRDIAVPVSTPADVFSSLTTCNTWSDPCFAPETLNVYSNYGFEVLGNILSVFGGYANWSAMNQALVTGPLGMAKTCARGDGCHPNFSTSHAHAYDYWGNELSLPAYSDLSSAEGGLWSTAEDMSTWLRYQLGYIAGSTTDLAHLDAVLPEMQQKLPSGSGWSWQFKQLTFSDGTTSRIRWKLGRYAGLNSYVGLADDRGTAVFVFVNRDGSDPAIEDPSDLLRDALGEPILAAFP